MIHTDKVKLMDSGTVLFRAASREEAVAKVGGAHVGGRPIRGQLPGRQPLPMRPLALPLPQGLAPHGPDQGRSPWGIIKIVWNPKIIPIFAVPIRVIGLATLAQSVEQRIRNAQVASSSLVSGSKRVRNCFRTLFVSLTVVLIEGATPPQTPPCRPKASEPSIKSYSARNHCLSAYKTIMLSVITYLL